MLILPHQGFWNDLSERNQKIAFQRSFDVGFGAETDLRDVAGKIVISHNMPKGGEIAFEEVLQTMNGRNLPLALNIKADGQAAAILELLAKYSHTNYFTFDMSIPDMVAQIKAGVRVFTGFSDILPAPILLDECSGVWLDCFNFDWYGADVIDSIIAKGKQVCVVSNDLHKRDTTKQWNIIKHVKNFAGSDLLLCTDKPAEAKEYFYDKD
jgi:hypothetical protein